MWQKPDDSDAEEEKTEFHLLVLLFPADKPLAEIQELVSKTLQQQIAYLFLYRNKVLQAHYQGDRLKKDILRAYLLAPAIIESGLAQTHETRPDLDVLQETLRQTLQSLSAYGTLLGQLAERQNTLDINLSNYKARVKKLKDWDDRNDLDAFDRFAELAESKYLRQLRADYESFKPGLTLLENAGRTVEGILAIDRAKRDRHTNIAIAVAGTGLAVSGVVASVIVEPVPEGENPWVYRASHIGISIGAGVAIAAIVWWVCDRLRR